MKGRVYVDVDYCQFSDWGYQKPTRIWGPMALGQLRHQVCDGKTCPHLITRSNGFLGHKFILGATPREGAARIKLEDQYRIPPGVIEFICGWNRKASDFRGLEQPFSVYETRLLFEEPDELEEGEGFFPFRPPDYPPPPLPPNPVADTSGSCSLCEKGQCGYVQPQDRQIHRVQSTQRGESSSTAGRRKRGHRSNTVWQPLQPPAAA